MINKVEKTSLFKLFYTFFIIGSITFGGGYAMLPFFEREIVYKNKWVSISEILDYYSISQCTPGIIAVNVSTFIGYKERGIKGAVAATLGVVFPSIIIITSIAMVLNNYIENVYIARALVGIKISVCALLLQSIIKLSKKSIIDKVSFVIFLLMILILFVFKLSIILIVILGIILGLTTSNLFKKSNREEIDMENKQ